MNKEQQRIKIAEACGFDKSHWLELKGGIVFGTSGSLPDYLNDLNAMHEAEATLDCVQQFAYAAYLYYGDPHEHAWDQVAAFEIAHATAAQRAEAFLRTLNLWEE